jgi:hypothetical protein
VLDAAGTSTSTRGEVSWTVAQAVGTEAGQMRDLTFSQSTPGEVSPTVMEAAGIDGAGNTKR